MRLDRFGFPWGEARLYGDAFVEALGPARDPAAAPRPGDADVARGIQDAVEALRPGGGARACSRATGARTLALAGGLFLNCAMNGRLARELSAEVRPFPVAGDAGAAWGAAALVHRRLTGRRAEALTTLRLGTDLDDAERALRPRRRTPPRRSPSRGSPRRSRGASRRARWSASRAGAPSSGRGRSAVAACSRARTTPRRATG